jgi:hypothetical protein
MLFLLFGKKFRKSGCIHIYSVGYILKGKMMKKCKSCSKKAGKDVFKSKRDFYKDCRNPDGLYSTCKKCKQEYNKTNGGKNTKRYISTANGRARSMWSHLLYRVKTDPYYIQVGATILKNDFLKWAIPAIEQFAKKHPDATPSLDRIDPKKGYKLSNIRIVDALTNSFRVCTNFEKLNLNKVSKKEDVYKKLAMIIDVTLDWCGQPLDEFQTYLSQYKWECI